ncbi:MAG: Tim44/TimA family putative adaptor protein, partial [Magnetococcales bacterium]|nr:Tim44/TimA family putative adaptor protein [Magnetococcales bacterium]
KWIATALAGVVLAGAVLVLWPEDAEARRAGGGASMGSRGSRTQAAPRQAVTPNQQPTMQRQGQSQSPGQTQQSPGQSRAQEAPRPQPAPPVAAPPPPRPGWGSTIMGGIGGFMLGGMLGSMLFGGHGGGIAGAGGGGGIGILDLLLLGGLAYLLYRAWRNWQASGGGRPTPRRTGSPPFTLPSPEKPLPSTFSAGKGGRTPPVDAHDDARLFQSEPELSSPDVRGGGSGGPILVEDDGDAGDLARGLRQIKVMDPRFHEGEFLAGARVAFELLQGAWRDWNVEQLRPLVTEQMWNLVARQALEDKSAGRHNVIEKIHFAVVDITEAWQEKGEDFITVRFDVTMVDYVTDAHGRVVEGDPNVSIQVEEYWTFVRPVGTLDPNWRLSAIQQPGAGIANPS